MKETIFIKKFPNGITLHLDPEISFEILLEEIATKFNHSRNFFRDARIALAFEGRDLSDEQEHQIIQTIHSNSDLQILCIIGKDEGPDNNFVKAIQKVNVQNSDEYGQFYRGSLKNNQKIEVESGIVILGDVYPGSTVSSTKDIIIIGGLYGEACAGVGNEEEHYIIALEMSPEKLKIGDFRYKPKDKFRLGLKKPKIQPKIAYVKEGQIVTEPITKESPELLLL